MSKLPVEADGVDNDNATAEIKKKKKEWLFEETKTKSDLTYLKESQSHTTNLLFSSQLKKQCCLFQ